MPRTVADMPLTAKRLLQEVVAASTRADAWPLIRAFDVRQLNEEQREATRRATDGCSPRAAPVSGPPLIVFYETTDDTPDGPPWPPMGEDYFWCAIKREHGRTTWRRVALQFVADRVPESPP